MPREQPPLTVIDAAKPPAALKRSPVEHHLCTGSPPTRRFTLRCPLALASRGKGTPATRPALRASPCLLTRRTPYGLRGRAWRSRLRWFGFQCSHHPHAQAIRQRPRTRPVHCPEDRPRSTTSEGYDARQLSGAAGSVAGAEHGERGNNPRLAPRE